jgi:NADH dehydrogenase
VEPLPDHVVPRRVVIVGGGFAGLFAARWLKRAPVEVTLVDRSANHVFQPLLYQYATGIVSEGQIAPPLRQVLAKQENCRVLMMEVTGFDLERRAVLARQPDGPAQELRYDYLIVGAGAGQSYFGNDAIAPYAPGMKTVDDALEIRRRVFGAFEMAELAGDQEERRAWLTFAIVGAGPTGVELAGQIRELALRTLRDEFRAIDPELCQVLLLDGGAQPLATFGDKLSGRAARTLRSLGVDFRPHSLVTGVDASGLDVKGPDGTVQRVPARTVIWAAGVQASPLAKALADGSGAELDRQGRIQVEPDCTLPGHPEVFAVGDMINLRNLPGVAEVAMQTGLHAANTIRRDLLDQPARRFRYLDLGSMAYVARGRAVVDFRGIKLTGFPAWLMWLVIHITFLTGFTSRLGALFLWIGAFAGRKRSQRAIDLGDLPLTAWSGQAPPAPEPEQPAPPPPQQPAHVRPRASQ